MNDFELNEYEEEEWIDTNIYYPERSHNNGNFNYYENQEIDLQDQIQNNNHNGNIDSYDTHEIDPNNPEQLMIRSISEYYWEC